MPTYVYECRTCEKVFEVEQRIVEDALKDCDCGSKGSLRRLIQPSAVMFKGSGFHINDYSSPAPSASEPKAEAPACSGEPSS
ncbi:MAG: hypothetical protein M9921_01280 [Fimbriimonadaceae bacterium]|nr:hypothetical protein [Fimbriimonadaceae bacterium]